MLKQDCVGKGRGSYVYICEVTMVRGGAILGHLRMREKSGVGKEEVENSLVVHNDFGIVLAVQF